MGRLREQMEKAAQGQGHTISPQCALRKICSTCHGRGFLLSATGATVTARLCACVETCPACFGAAMLSIENKSRPCKTPSPKRLASMFNEAALPSRYIDADIKSFKNLTGNGREVMQRVSSWLNVFTPEKGPGLILSGPVGVGKTFLLVAIAKHLIMKSYSVKFVDFHRLLSVIRSAYADRKSEEGVLAPLIEAEVLIIDELGKGRNNDWEQEKLDQIVMGRYNQNKPIIASTNYSLKPDSGIQALYNAPLDLHGGQRNSFNPDIFESLESRVGKRIFSRLFESSLMIEMQGDDYRRLRRIDVAPEPRP